MSLPDLAAVLWRQRELLERLSYRLECEQLLLAAGRARWLSQATSEVESLLAELQVVELQRASAAQAAAASSGCPTRPAWRSSRPAPSHRGAGSCWSTATS